MSDPSSTVPSNPCQTALWSKTQDATQRALALGTLLPIATKSVLIRDHDIEFLVRVISNLKRKREEKKNPRKPSNPFLPYEESMFVSKVSNNHVCLLNKFNVIENHLLIVTRHYENQEQLLTIGDFRAALSCLKEIRGLCFYNGGEEAGASQHHKHLQLIPLPMTEGKVNVPIEPLLTSALTVTNRPTSLPVYNFVHGVAKLPSLSQCTPELCANEAFRTYRELLQITGLNPLSDPEISLQSAPYNLLFTDSWMLLVPRSKEHFAGISMNSLAYVGALLVQNEEQMRAIESSGPLSAIAATAVDNS
jgi:ATP adenylyltransferase